MHLTDDAVAVDEEVRGHAHDPVRGGDLLALIGHLGEATTTAATMITAAIADAIGVGAHRGRALPHVDHDDLDVVAVSGDGVPHIGHLGAASRAPGGGEYQPHRPAPQLRQRHLPGVDVGTGEGRALDIHLGDDGRLGLRVLRIARLDRPPGRDGDGEGGRQEDGDLAEPGAADSGSPVRLHRGRRLLLSRLLPRGRRLSGPGKLERILHQLLARLLVVIRHRSAGLRRTGYPGR